MVSNQTLDFAVRNLSKSSTSLHELRIGKLKDFGTLKKRVSSSGNVTVSSSDEYDFQLKKSTRVEFKLFNKADKSRIGIFGDTKARVQATLFTNSGKKLDYTERLAPQRQETFRSLLTSGEYVLKITGRSDDDIPYSVQLKPV
jgi:hypothetical protein